MIHEVADPRTGAIIFKKDQDSKNIEYLLKRVDELGIRIEELETKIKELEEKK